MTAGSAIGRDRPLPGWLPVALALAGVGAVMWYALTLPPAVVVSSTAVAVLGVGGLAYEWWNHRLFSIAAFAYSTLMTTWGLRPLYIHAHLGDLDAYRGPRSAIEFLTDIRTQELAEFITYRYPGNADVLLQRAQVLGLVFAVLFVTGRVVGSRLPARDLGDRVLANRPSPQVLVAIISTFIAIGLLGQVAVVRGAGGFGVVLGSIENQATLRQPFAYFVLAGFMTGAAALWAAFGRTRGWPLVGLACLMLEVVAFASLTGSRSRMFIPVLVLILVVHLGRRRLRRREVLAMALAVMMLATAALSVRQASAGRPLGQSLREGLGNAATLRVAVNDSSQFDTVVTMMGVVPQIIPPQHGARLRDGVLAFLPGPLVPDKPPTGDVWFKEQVWGKARAAGRPYTFPGELWLDFGLPAVGVGAFLYGLLAGRFRGTGRDGRLPPGAAVAGAVAIVGISGLVDGVYATTLSFGLEMILPVAVAAVWSAAVHAGAARRDALVAPAVR